ncbi:Ribonuclease H-like domain containing protein [Lactarius tabidus]
MDPMKPYGEACTPDGGLKEAHEIKWANDPDDASEISNCKSSPPRQSSTQTTLSVFGVVTQGQKPEGDVIGSSNNSEAPTAATRPPGQRSKTEQSIVTDDKDILRPCKKKKKARVITENDADTDNDNISIDEGSKRSKTHVLSQVPEDTQDTHANTKASNDLDGSGNTSSGDTNTTEGGSWESDEELDYSQMDKMATKDTKTLIKPRMWLVGNVSTCRTHIIRQWNMHKEQYLTGCQCENIEPNQCMMSSVAKAPEGTRLQEQSSLEGWTVAKESQWSKQGLMEHIIELVVVDNQAFSLVDCAAFRRLLMFLRPATKDCDIPHCTSVANTVHEKAHKVKDILKVLFACVPGEVSVTLDGWSSLAHDPYLGVTVHWVHSTPEFPSKWSLCTLLLAFWEVKGNHSSENLAKLVMEIINDAGLPSKIGWITSDNITSNDKMMARLEDKLDSSECEWKAPQCCVRCLVHIVHLAVKHIVQAFSQEGPLMESEFPLDTLPAGLDKDTETLYVSGNTLGKLWAFINQCCTEEGLPHLELIKYVCTHWSSMYNLLECAFLLKLGITKFIQLADDSAQVPKLQKKSYANYRLASNEWTNLDLLHQILRHPALAQQQFSSECVPTISRVFPTIEFLLMSLKAGEKDATFTPIGSAITAGILNLTKCNVLDPSIKLAYVKKNWGPDFVLHIKTILATIFDKYNQAAKEDSAATALPSHPG